MRGRSWRYDNKTSAVCSLLPSTSQRERYHLTGLLLALPPSAAQPKLAISAAAAAAAAVILAACFQFHESGPSNGFSVFCGLPTHMVRVAIWSRAPHRLFGGLAELWRGGWRQMKPPLGVVEGYGEGGEVGHNYWEACTPLVFIMTAAGIGLRRPNTACSWWSGRCDVSEAPVSLRDSCVWCLTGLCDWRSPCVGAGFPPTVPKHAG